MAATYCRNCPPDAKSCGSRNAEGMWCTREHGHPGFHVACSADHEIATWVAAAPAASPAPIDPLLATLTAAALTGLAPMAADMTEEWIASKAKRLALATRAALVAAMKEGES